MKNLIVVNGETYWPTYFPGLNVHRVRIQDTGWVLRGDGLWCIAREGAWQADAVLWRLGAVRPHWTQRAALETIRLSGVPCISASTALLKCHERLTMLAELKEAGIPIQPLVVIVGERLLTRHGLDFPFVVKVGSHDGGYGKVLIKDAAQWSEVSDLLFVADDFATVEPFVEHTRDIRCLLIGDQYWGMERRGAGWRANVDTVKARLIDPPAVLLEYTRRAQKQLGSTSIALDALERPDGSFVVLEANDPPGLSGFPDAARTALATLMKTAMQT